MIVGLAEGALLRGSLLVYLLPLALLLAGALLGQAAFVGAGEAGEEQARRGGKCGG